MAPVRFPRWLHAVGGLLALLVLAGLWVALPVLWAASLGLSAAMIALAGLAGWGLWSRWPSWRPWVVARRARAASAALSRECEQVVARGGLSAPELAGLVEAREALSAAERGHAGDLALALATFDERLAPYRRGGPVWRGLAGRLGLGLLAALVVRSFFFGVYRIPTASMVPSLLVGDHLVVDRTAYLRDAPDAGDVVVFEHADPGGATRTYAKRVIATEGQTLAFAGRTPIVDGRPLARELVGEAQLGPLGDPERRASFFFEHELWSEGLGERTWTTLLKRTVTAPDTSPVLVPSGHVFVAGDNRDDSTDSRDPAFGPVPVASIVGRGRWIAFSAGESGVRWDRISSAIR